MKTETQKTNKQPTQVMYSLACSPKGFPQCYAFHQADVGRASWLADLCTPHIPHTDTLMKKSTYNVPLRSWPGFLEPKDLGGTTTDRTRSPGRTSKTCWLLRKPCVLHRFLFPLCPCLLLSFSILALLLPSLFLGLPITTTGDSLLGRLTADTTNHRNPGLPI